MPNPFTPSQNTVLAHINSGQTLQQAAEAAGVHRNTVLNWRRTDPEFQNAWHEAHFDQAMHWRDQVLPLASLAIDTIRQILEDPTVAPSIRLRAALAVQKIVSAPLPAPPKVLEAADLPAAAQPEIVHNLAQSRTMADAPNQPAQGSVTADPVRLAGTVTEQFDQLLKMKREKLDARRRALGQGVAHAPAVHNPAQTADKSAQIALNASPQNATPLRHAA